MALAIILPPAFHAGNRSSNLRGDAIEPVTSVAGSNNLKTGLIVTVPNPFPSNINPSGNSNLWKRIRCPTSNPCHIRAAFLRAYSAKSSVDSMSNSSVRQLVRTSRSRPPVVCRHRDSKARNRSQRSEALTDAPRLPNLEVSPLRLVRLRLHLKRTHVAHRVAWFAALVRHHRLAVRIEARLCGNHAYGDATRKQRVGHRRPAVVRKRSEV
jgi:hypothetical protein